MKNKKYLYIFLIIVPIIIFFVGRSFSLTYTQEIRSVEIESNDYDDPGSWHIDKSAKWISSTEAEVNFDLQTVYKERENANYKDVILVMDISVSMSGTKIDKAKSDAMELVNLLLSNHNNHVALITFDSTSTIVSGFINNKDEMLNMINSLTVNGCTNYNEGLLNVLEVMENYQKDDNHDLVTLFLTDGYPNEDIPNQVATYNIIKDKYPYMAINGIQYEMGTEIIQEIIDISDNQWIANQETLNGVLFDAVDVQLRYETFVVSDYVNKDYFYLDNISDVTVSGGTVELQEENGLQKIVWTLDDNLTGFKANMKIKLSLKSEYTNESGFYPTNDHETIDYKIIDEEENVNSTLTPVLKRTYNVIYNSNAPTGCSLPNIPVEEHYVYENVIIRQEILSCTGYLFKGWEIIDSDKDDLTIKNDDMFEMPEHDVHINAIWTKQELVKSMDGEVREKMTLYKVLQRETEIGTYALKFTREHQDSFDNSGTSDIYYYNASSDENGTEILNKNNVIFANQCWQMIRTTDTGGVKMIYNGEAESGKCLNTRGNHIGYGRKTTQDLSGIYYYSDDYIYDKTNNNFKLSGTSSSVEVTSSNASSVIPTLKGKYTCRNTSEDGTCSILYLIYEYMSDTQAYVLPTNTNSHYSTWGDLEFNEESNSPSYVGYMYNKVYEVDRINIDNQEKMNGGSAELSTTYWYADSVTWGNPLRSRYNLNNPYQVSSTSDYSSLVGKYTFRSTYNGDARTTVYYITAVSNGTMYYIQLSGGNSISDYNYQYIYGSTYTDNGDGTYTINNPVPFETLGWYNIYIDVLDKFVCKNPVNNTCSELWHVNYQTTMYEIKYEIVSNIKYASGFTYDENTGTYILNDDSVVFWDLTNNTNITSLNQHHYTCFNLSGVCEKIAYIYNFATSYVHYILLEDGMDINDAVYEMLYADDVNTINSTIKTGIETWYKKYLLNYDDYIEDVIYCNARSQSNEETNGWNPNGGSISTFMFFRSAPGLRCPNITDSFSVFNNKAQLSYKVGLISYGEMNILDNNNVRKTGQSYWLGSPISFDTDANEYTVSQVGGWVIGSVKQPKGVRPVISLVPNIEYLYGDGSMENPYQIDDGTH